MRKFVRPNLSARAAAWLASNSVGLMHDLTIDVTARWTARRKTMNGNGIVRTLTQMCGRKVRCMYCGDSEACDVEHFYPKAELLFRDKVFLWSNFLYICAPCNRLKNAKFTLLAGGIPAFLNPVDEDPWNYFDFVEETGEIVARADLVGLDLQRAQATLDTKSSRLCFETITEARRCAARAIRRAVSAFEQSDQSPEDEEEFVEDIVSQGRPELARWYFSGAFPAPDRVRLFVGNRGDLVLRVKHRMDAEYPGGWA